MGRALIIGVENYAQSHGLDATLPGTTQAATRFRQWLIERKQLAADQILFCAEAGTAGRTHGTNRADLLRAILEVVQGGKDRTDELFVFYSGHGFAYPESPSRKPLDVVVGADFESAALSGGACLKLQEIQTKLWYAMGPGNHYYFVDACRTMIQPTDINVPDCGIMFGTSELGRPTVYTLCSTTLGQPAWVASGFSGALIDALGGRGRAKGWSGTRLVVTFDLVCRYLLSAVQRQPVDSTKEGSGDGVLFEVAPVPQYACDIAIDGALPGDRFVAEMQDSRQHSSGSEAFTGGSHTLTLVPDDYFVTVKMNAQPLTLADPSSPPVDLYEPRQVRFVKAAAAPAAPVDPGEGMPPAPAAPVEAAPAMVSVAGGGPTTVQITHVQTGQQISAPDTFSGPLPAGTYAVKIQQQGATVAAADLTVSSGQRVDLDLAALRLPSPVSAEMVAALPVEARVGQLAFLSESLGEPVASSDEGLLLSLAGASRIVADPESFSKLRALPFATFEDLPAGQSAVYVLAGRDETGAPSHVKFDDGGWHPLAAAGTLAFVSHEKQVTAPGAHLVSFHAVRRPAASIAIQTYAAHVTLLVVTADRSGRLRGQQFALPAVHLAGGLPREQVEYLLRGRRSPLQIVWTSYLMQRQFAERQHVAPPSSEPGFEDWQALIEGRWVDPIMTAIAAYELVRTGLTPDSRGTADRLVALLRDHFKSPDAEALAKLLGRPWQQPPGPPAMLDGVMALGGPLPLGVDHLDYESPWTVWRGAVTYSDAEGAPAIARRAGVGGVDQ
jgi:hypothetical protein